MQLCFEEKEEKSFMVAGNFELPSEEMLGRIRQIMGQTERTKTRRFCFFVTTKTKFFENEGRNKMNKKQYEAMRKALMDEAQNLLNNGDAEGAEKKMDEVKDLDNKWDAIAQAQANFNALNNEPLAMNPFGQTGEILDFVNGEEPKNDVERRWESDEYKNAWAKHLMNKKMTNDEAQTFKMVNEAYTHTTENTGVVIPKTVAKGIWEMAGEMYPYFQDVTKTYVPGVLSMIQEETSSDSGWYTEDAPTEDGKETLKEFTLSGCELSRSITVSWKLREMAIEDFIPYIQRKMAKKWELEQDMV